MGIHILADAGGTSLKWFVRDEKNGVEYQFHIEGLSPLYLTEEEIEQAIAHCQQKNWQNDQRFTESYLHSRSQRGYGLQRIKQELRQLKGVESATIDVVLSQCDIDWSALALNLLRKKFPNYMEKQPPKMKQKIWQYMLSHGFHSDEFADYVGSESQEFD